MELKYIIIWAIVCILSAIIEAATLQLVSVWFMVGSIGALISGFLGASFAIQCLVFLIVSLVLITTLLPLLRKKLKTKHIPLNADSVINKKGIVVETIDNIKGVGLVKVDNQIWSAKSNNNLLIPKDTIVLVKEIKGVKLIVNSIEENNYESMAT